MTIETNLTKLDHFVYYPVTIHFRTSYIIYDICTTRSRSSLLLKVRHGDRKIQSATVPPGCGGVALVHRDTPASIESGSRPSFARSDHCRNREPSDFQSVLATPEPEGQNGKRILGAVLLTSSHQDVTLFHGSTLVRWDHGIQYLPRCNDTEATGTCPNSCQELVLPKVSLLAEKRIEIQIQLLRHCLQHLNPCNPHHLAYTCLSWLSLFCLSDGRALELHSVSSVNDLVFSSRSEPF